MSAHGPTNPVTQPQVQALDIAQPMAHNLTASSSNTAAMVSERKFKIRPTIVIPDSVRLQ